MVYQGKFLDTGRADDVRDVVRHSGTFYKVFQRPRNILTKIFKGEVLRSTWLRFWRLRVLRRDCGVGLGGVAALFVPVRVFARMVS